MGNSIEGLDYLDPLKRRTPPVGVLDISHGIHVLYGIFTYIYHKNQPNVGKYTIHGWYGFELMVVKHIVKLYIYLTTPTQPPKKNTIQMDDFSKSVIFAKDHNIYITTFFL